MRSILLHIYEDTELEARLQTAFDLARAFESHLTCLHATPFEDYFCAQPFLAAALPVDFSSKMRKQREKLQAEIEERLKIEGVSWDWVHVDDLISDALIRRSPLADLVIVSRASADLMRDDARVLGGKLATRSYAPTLVVPPGARGFDPSAPAILAWNGSPEAATAMRAALPLLKTAAAVHVLVIDDELAEYPADGAARYLARHDIGCELVQRPASGTVWQALAGGAKEFGAGLIVMGAYGHSRLREFLLGGVTRAMLDQTSSHVLMAH